MFLSIITINRNNADGLKRTINSVALQTYRDFEHIIIDGASTDNSIDIIKEYVASFAGKNVSYWVSEPDSGIYNAMNKGIKKAKGDYCLFLNSGDSLYTSEVIQKVIPFSKQGKPFICGKLKFDTGKIVSIDRELNIYTFYHFFIPHQSIFIQRKLFDIYGLYDESLTIISDHVFFYITMVKNHIEYINVDEIISLYDTKGISTTASDKSYQEYEAYFEKELPADLYKILNENLILKEQFKAFKSSITYKLISFFSKPIFYINQKLHK